jgi:hypothetical protein
LRWNKSHLATFYQGERENQTISAKQVRYKAAHSGGYPRGVFANADTGRFAADNPGAENRVVVSQAGDLDQLLENGACVFGDRFVLMNGILLAPSRDRSGLLT